MFFAYEIRQIKQQRDKCVEFASYREVDLSVLFFVGGYLAVPVGGDVG